MNRTCVGAGIFALILSTSAPGAELKSVEQLSDVRGSIVYRTYCVLCHGAYADGNGRTSKHLKPPPANLTTSEASDEYKEAIIRKGGAAMGRSPHMPPWGQELTDEQIKDVIVYLRVINVNKPKTSKN